MSKDKTGKGIRSVLQALNGRGYYACENIEKLHDYYGVSSSISFRHKDLGIIANVEHKESSQIVVNFTLCDYSLSDDSVLVNA